MSKKVININKNRSKKDIMQTYKQMYISVHKEIIDMHEQSMINYNQYKTLLNRLNEVVNDVGDKK